MRFLSLFAGIGGADLGLERAGMTCVGQVEIEPFCQKVLAKHWPNVWRWNDVKTLTGAQVAEHCGTIDLLCGGVPCQPASVAGKRLGTADHRWLWPDFLRLVSEVQPVWVLAENPRGVLSLDVAGVQFSEWIAREFTARGYGLLPVKLAAEDVGAPHRRERIFFVAKQMGNAQSDGRDGQVWNNQWQTVREALRSSAKPNVANADNARLAQHAGQRSNSRAEFPAFIRTSWPARPGRTQYEWEEPRTVELQVGESVAGLPIRLARRHRVAALKALGNAIVPQVAEVIGRAILQMEAETPELRRAA
jgi:DNA (cytosine-5)-methyltransferase 1